MHSIDIFIQNYFALARTPSLTEFSYIITSLFDPTIYTIIVFSCFILLIRLVKSFRHAVLFTSSLLFGCMLVYLLKSFFAAPRPTDYVILVLGHSFPSYHATIATIFFCMLMYIFDEYWPSSIRILFNTVCVFGIFAVGFSRVYLGVHWISDVFFGILLGCLVAYFFIIIFEVERKRVIQPGGAPSMVE